MSPSLYCTADYLNANNKLVIFSRLAHQIFKALPARYYKVLLVQPNLMWLTECVALATMGSSLNHSPTLRIVQRTRHRGSTMIGGTISPIRS